MSQTEELKRLKELVGQLKEENQQLVNRNMQLSDQLCMWYELRQRANWLKEEMLSDQRRMQRADLLTTVNSLQPSRRAWSRTCRY